MSKPNLLFIAGWATDASLWSSVCRELGVEEGEPTHIPWQDCLSSAPASNALLQRLAMPGERFILVGASLGGLIALLAASAAPQPPCGLVLVSTTAKMIAEKDYPGVDRRAYRAMQIKLEREREVVLRDFVRRCLAPRKDPGVENAFFDRAGRIDGRTLSDGLRYLAETDARGLLETLRVPTWVLHGACDEIIPVASARFMAERIPGARYEEIAGEGHALTHSVPDKIAFAVRSLLHGHR